MDLSHLDKKYFIDPHKYNCAFCQRNHVSYSLTEATWFDWTDKKRCIIYLVKCDSCEKISSHFSFKDIRKKDKYGYFQLKFSDTIDIDNNLFLSIPSSFFTLDERIPREIRDLVFEAEQSRQANLLVGASACIRKAIYALIEREKAVIRREATGYADYQESIKSLKKKFPNVAAEFFDTLGEVQEMVSDMVHEGSWEAWDSKKLRFLIELTKATLHEMYVIPDERKKSIGLLSQMKSMLVGAKEAASPDDGESPTEAI